MVCLGNICRSPLAEEILRHKAAKAGLDWEIDSAGTNGFHIGEAPHKLSQKVAKANGLDISAQKARQFLADDLKQYDKIYVMADDVMADVKRISKLDSLTNVDYFLNASRPGENLSVPDPWYGDEDGYVECYDLIAKNCDAIIENHLRSN